jgi:hypothetical protein
MNNLPLFYQEPIIKIGGKIMLQLISTFLMMLYFITSVVGLFIASINYHSLCEQKFQLLIILESVISLPILIYSIYIIRTAQVSCCGMGFLIAGFIFSANFIITGMSLLYDKKQENKCPYIIYIFSCIYFNLWWVLLCFGILFILMVYPIYRNYKLRIDI